jgi:hypothetical protein
MASRDVKVRTTHEDPEEVRCCRMGRYYCTFTSAVSWDVGTYYEPRVTIFSTSTRLIWNDAS